MQAVTVTGGHPLVWTVESKGFAMRRRRASLAVVLFVLISTMGLSTVASGAPGDADRLELYRATVDAAALMPCPTAAPPPATGRRA